MMTTEEIEQARFWRQLYDMAPTKAQRDRIRAQAAKSMGVRDRTMTARWHRLGMARVWNFMTPIVQDAISKYPYGSDRALAARYGVVAASFTSTRVRLGIESCLVRRRKALREEVAIYVREYPELTATQVRDSIRADGDLSWGFSRETVKRVMEELRNE